jgi:preprotein translocase subunit SecA
LRRQLLEGLDQKDLILEDYVSSAVGDLLDQYAPANVHAEQWDTAALKQQIFTRFGVDLAAEGVDFDRLNRTELGDSIFGKLKQRYEAKEKLIGPDAMRYHERMIMLSVLDGQWKDHLLSMDHLKEGIGLRGYGQHDPLVEYKRESYEMFEAMMQRFQEETVRYLYLLQVIEAEPQRQQASAGEGLTMDGVPFDPTRPVAPPPGQNGNRRAATSMDDMEREFRRKKERELQAARMAGAGDSAIQQRRVGDKIGRNDPCPCGSGKKYKRCCGA